MCRYAIYGPYKEHYACFHCRKCFRYHQASVCPQCRGPLYPMGLDFKAPKQKDKEQWKVLKILYDHGITFHSCGCSGPGYRPTRMKELPAFLKAHQASRQTNP